ncbi:outer membrane protein assembly factor BamB family protein [Natronorubrum halophilum]|uniref:outer membrane protein assembly factor BamB family protein n=1 Tax=Natronorubrum halophilum TaxID=1702106 RepID=UPI0010C1A519|nr:PQQ-binding-like beta-propeller repeat protein [Natronorubrum halophilum]
MGRRSNRTRRQWLVACSGATAGLTALAGCADSDDEDDPGNGDDEDGDGEQTVDGDSDEAASGTWPMSRFTADNRMVAEDRSGPDGPLEERWTIEMDEVNFSGPVVDNGLVYVADDRSTLHAIELASGETEWEFDDAEASPTTPAVTNDAIYFLTDTLYAIDLENGDELWSIELGSSGSGDIRVFDDIVYVHNDGELYAIDVSNEAIIWEGEAGETQDIAIGDDGTFYVIRRTNSGHDYEAMAFDVFEDETLWSYSPPGNVQTGFGLMVRDETVYTHEEESIVAIDGKTGTAETVVEYEQTEETTPTDGIAPTSANGIIYSGGAYGYNVLFATELDSGEEPDTWNPDALENGPNGFQPFVSDDTLYIWRRNGFVQLDALDPETGEQQWTTHTTGHVDLLGGVVEGYAILEESVLFTYNAGSGSAIGALEAE